MLTYETAMEFFRYEPSSGKLFWKKAPGKKVKVGAEVGCIKKKNTNLGYFKTIEEAAKVRKAAEIKYGYHPNHGL